MKDAVLLDDDSDDENSAVGIHTNGILHSLSQLTKLNIPAANEAVHRILGCFKFGQNTETTRERRSEKTANKGNVTKTAKKRRAETDEERRERNNTDDEWQCKDCDRVFCNKTYLDRHINNEHSAKKSRLVQHEVYECDDCDCEFSSEAALKNHEKTHSEAPKSTKYKCDLCNKERSGIYNHYRSMHKIEYPEQILFYTGNALVTSAIDTKGGKAPWFIKEKDKVTKRYTDLTCRLCESEPGFDDAEMLEVHYTLIHMVDPGLLNNLNFLFRAAKGSHLGLSAAIPKQSIISTPEPFQDGKKTEDGKIRWLCGLCDGTFSNKANLKRHVLIHAANHSEKRAFDRNRRGKTFDAEPSLQKHKTVNHTDDKSSPKKDKCEFCHKTFANIYKHYGNLHNIEYPEQIMIENGNVLIVSDIDTKRGQAPWFIKEKAKMQSLKPSTCRLCETEYDNGAMLEKHYRLSHSVVPSALPNLQYMFRATKGAHLADLPTDKSSIRRKHRIQSSIQNASRSSDNKVEIKFASSEHKNKILIPLVEKKDVNGVIVYQCETCEVATSTYDACVEHAQLHHLDSSRQLQGTIDTQTCRSCKLVFEQQCFAAHSSNCTRTERKILRYNPSNLLNDDWFNMFQGLPDTVANQIKSSSVYEHTRAIKINSAEVSGIPLYQCGVCELYVHPKEVEEHCNNKNTCVKNKSHDYYCPECDIYFYSLVAITEHCKEHKNGREINSFRKASFNCREDTIINKALREIQSAILHGQAVPRDENVPPVGIPSETPQRSRRSIDILENRPINKACAYCNKYILISELEAHEATHKRVTEDDSDLIMESEEEIRLDPHDKECDPRDALQNRAAMTGCNDGTVEAWNSDSEPCSLNGTPYDVQVEVHVQKEELDEENDKEYDTNNQSDYSQDIVENTQIENPNRNNVFDDNIMVEIFSEEMANNLKMDAQSLFSDTGSDTKSADDVTTQDLLNILDDTNKTENVTGNIRTDVTDALKETNNNEDKLPTESESVVSRDVFASDPNENQDDGVNPEVSMDIFSEKGRESNDINNANESVIMDTIILDDDDDSIDPGATIDQKNRENERQRLIDETKRIRELMFSRE